MGTLLIFLPTSAGALRCRAENQECPQFSAIRSVPNFLIFLGWSGRLRHLGVGAQLREQLPFARAHGIEVPALDVAVAPHLRGQ
jgi:hypothetical protein